MKIVLIVSGTALILFVGVLFRSGRLVSAFRRQLGLSLLSATDANGDKWVLQPASGQKLSRFKDGDTKPGLPLLVRTDVQTKGRNISIGLVIEGQAGEVYQPGATKNGGRVAAPKFKIVDESGNVVGSGPFEYG
jgi:hypothetical protein